MTPKVSVLMPVLNPDPCYFEQAVESILRQSMPNWELIIPEDPSPRKASDTLKKFPDARIRHILNDNRTSLVSQLNQALHLANGEYIARLDADDIAEPNRLEEQCRALDENTQLGVLGCQKTIIGSNGEVIGIRNYPLNHKDIITAICRYNPIAHPGVIMRRDLVYAVNGYSHDSRVRGAEDYDLWWRLLKTGVYFSNHPGRLIRYRIQPQQTKIQQLHQQLRATINIKRANWSSLGELDKLRFFGELTLLKIPASLVIKLFFATTYSPVSHQ